MEVHFCEPKQEKMLGENDEEDDDDNGNENNDDNDKDINDDDNGYIRIPIDMKGFECYRSDEHVHPKFITLQ